MNQHEIHLDNIEQAVFPYDWRQKGNDWILTMKKKRQFSYRIISTAWFLHNFFALFSIKETIWWAGETWSIDRELSVPENSKTISFFFSFNQTFRWNHTRTRCTWLCNKLNIAFRNFSNCCSTCYNSWRWRTQVEANETYRSFS